MNLKAVNFQQKFSLLTEQWKPKVVAEAFIVLDGEVKLLLVEPRGVLNTGHEASARTTQNDVWI